MKSGLKSASSSPPMEKFCYGIFIGLLFGLGGGIYGSVKICPTIVSAFPHSARAGGVTLAILVACSIIAVAMLAGAVVGGIIGCISGCCSSDDAMSTIQQTKTYSNC